MLFDYLKLSGPLEEQASRQNGIQWAQNRIMIFLDSHKERVRRKELAAVPLRTTIEEQNYFVK